MNEPNKNSIITLREVTADTVRAITQLAVAEEQRRNVATNAESMAQAYFHPEAWFRAIYADDTPVGFVMLEDRTDIPNADPKEPICLWRFMIDQRFQGFGYGKRALELIVEHVRRRTKLDHMLTSCVEGPHSPKEFYIKFGFVPTGEFDDGEAVLRFDL